MRTIKRSFPSIETDYDNNNKYLNQLEFTGIVEDTNIFDVDQMSLSDALNVYIDGDHSLASRPPLVQEDLPEELTGELVEIKVINNVVIYVTKSEGLYSVSAYKDNQLIREVLNNITKYKISIFNQYAILWNDLGAKVLDTNDTLLQWKSLNDFVHIPITKTTIGSSVEELSANQLTDSKIERYIRTAEAPTVLPTKNELGIRHSYNSIGNYVKYNDIRLYSPWQYTDLRLLKEVYRGAGTGTVVDWPIAARDKVLAISYPNNILLSLDYGSTFVSINYPSRPFKTPTLFDISKNGDALFYYDSSEKVIYRYIIGTKVWTGFKLPDLPGNEIILQYNYLSADTFAVSSNVNIYIHNNKISDGNNIPDFAKFSLLIPDTIPEEDRPFITISAKHIPVINITTNDNYTIVSTTTYIYTSEDETNYHVLNAIIGNSSDTTASQINNLITNTANTYIESEYFTIESVTINNLVISDTSTYDLIFSGTCSIPQGFNSYLYSYNYEINNDTNKFTNSLNSGALTIRNYEYPINVNGIYLMPDVITSDRVCSIVGSDLIVPRLPNTPTVDSTGLVPVGYIYPVENGYYMAIKGSDENDNQILVVVSNILTEGERFEVDYNYRADTEYSDVPNLSYSGSELYLGFDNILKITSNISTDENTLFNLPPINNQAFADTITNIINISTTELAIFFTNKILICQKVEDELLGFRYDYLQTRLSLGVRLGDDVINTLDGANSVFPTVRGLAILNYQAYMATSDQVVTFISDKISDIWTDFYKESDSIKILQMRDYIFVYNGTNKFLMLDIRNWSWWKFEVPYNINLLFTDQIKLSLISKKLYYFDTNYNINNYRDDENQYINWLISSQRLHFNLPNHYKNIKQLIFQLIQSSNFKHSILADLKIYRKVIDYREPEYIEFKIDEFRTFVKRFNYWKINELQYTLYSDNEVANPSQLKLNGISIKYEPGEEVR